MWAVTADSYADWISRGADLTELGGPDIGPCCASGRWTRECRQLTRETADSDRARCRLLDCDMDQMVNWPFDLSRQRDELAAYDPPVAEFLAERFGEIAVTSSCHCCQ